MRGRDDSFFENQKPREFVMRKRAWATLPLEAASSKREFHEDMSKCDKHRSV